MTTKPTPTIARTVSAPATTKSAPVPSKSSTPQAKIPAKSPKPITNQAVTAKPGTTTNKFAKPTTTTRPLPSKAPSLSSKPTIKTPIPPKTAPKTQTGAQSSSLKRKLSTPTVPLAKKQKRDIEDDYDYDDGFVVKEDKNDYLPLGDLLRKLGYTRGPTNVDVYRKLDPHYDPSSLAGQHMLDDDDDECMEVTSFIDHCEMDAKTAKRAIEEDKKEREEEKRQKKLEAERKLKKVKSK
uniref:Uncharacterized protein n=1 Tax=Arcella intermedia TaxID=1963864 RepID=A0A6B2LDW9_9EUKA